MTRTNAERVAAGPLVTLDGVAGAPTISTTLDGYHEGPNQEFDFWTVDDAPHGTGVDATLAERTTLWQNLDCLRVGLFMAGVARSAAVARTAYPAARHVVMSTPTSSDSEVGLTH